MIIIRSTYKFRRKMVLLNNKYSKHIQNIRWMEGQTRTIAWRGPYARPIYTLFHLCLYHVTLIQYWYQWWLLFWLFCASMLTYSVLSNTHILYMHILKLTAHHNLFEDDLQINYIISQGRFCLCDRCFYTSAMKYPGLAIYMTALIYIFINTISNVPMKIQDYSHTLTMCMVSLIKYVRTCFMWGTLHRTDGRTFSYVAHTAITYNSIPIINTQNNIHYSH